jgi:hypothetical protein
MRQPPQHAEPEHVRRKLAEAYRKEAGNPRRKKAERTTFLRMAESWERTLPKP